MKHCESKTSITALSGVGTKRAAALGKLGIFTLEDLLSHFPRTYEDRTVTKKILELCDEETVCIRAVVSSSVQTNIVRKNLKIHTVKVTDGTGFLELVWFNNPYIERRLKKGETYIFYGKVRFSPKKQMLTPLIDSPEHPKQTGMIYPVYPLTEGLTDSFVSDCVKQALEMLSGKITDPLPKELRKKYQLAELSFALQNIHFPKGKTEYQMARRRLAFQELFLFQLALFTLKKRRQKDCSPKMDAPYDVFTENLPFTLTDAQERVISEIAGDLKSGKTMNRLVCGDVGSGKTAVAAAAMYIAAKSGYQAAFMAPTEILAQQHYQSLTRLFAESGIKTELLLGSMSQSARKKAGERLLSGESHIAIGTHALISDSVRFQNLGLAITDEQHRFGVNQRRKLSEKGEHPHVLVMTATPIPRTLALLIYGDLDVSIIDTLPPGRQKIDTFALGESYRDRVYGFLQKELACGHQAYIVCPLVEESDALELHAATEYAKTLQKTVLKDFTVGLLHGKMKAAEKDEVMRRFKEGEVNVLVSTTVIEVGVDVPNATMMLIENAERFGLSQLHQLRGRVGRGKEKSYCILLTKSRQESAHARLSVMKNEESGFKIAEEDLKQRGPGEFFGTRQHGLPAFHFTEIYTNMDWLRETAAAAGDFLSQTIPATKEEIDELRQKMNDLFDNRVTFD